jgi:hypothetical protein
MTFGQFRPSFEVVMGGHVPRVLGVLPATGEQAAATAQGRGCGLT